MTHSEYYFGVTPKISQSGLPAEAHIENALEGCGTRARRDFRVSYSRARPR